MSHTWWNETGEFQALHALNALRVPWITNSLVEKQDQPSPLHTKPLLGLQILDAGSGGGILSEVPFSPYFCPFNSTFSSAHIFLILSQYNIIISKYIHETPPNLVFSTTSAHVFSLTYHNKTKN